ncbi:MAG TPA: hypothetical protein VLY63_19805 [Anaerolineae bacterium]|nr:hypothetical protein [Anaerolineae bacterium]
MSVWAHLTTRVYRVLLAFYPSGFRAEFDEEMQDVFATALTEAQRRGGERPWRLFWCEIRGWPGSVLREHLRARRREMASNGLVKEKPLLRIELLAALIIFLLPLLWPLFGILAATGNSLPRWVDTTVLVLLLGVVLSALGLAIVKGLPRWSLSYLGFVLMLGFILSRYDRIWGWIYPFFIQSFGPRSVWPLQIRIFYVAVFDFIVFFSILLGALILVNLLRLLPHTRGVWQRIRADWTQLSFLLYGGLVISTMLLFDEYHHANLWQLVAWSCLTLGAWLYLRAKRKKQRVLALICGATGAMWIVALAKWVVIPLQKWPTGYPVSPSEATRWVEVGSAMIGWVWILVMLLAPALLSFLPQLPDSIDSSERGPVAA